ncbi:MAG: hypothetical protein LDL33_06140 [Desulfomonile sp.]|nr:hypothetical protein [Desulfomonile sp.]
MAPPLLIPVLRLIGWAAAGFAVAVGWKLGSELVEVAMGRKTLKWPEWPSRPESSESKTDILMRRFDKVSGQEG